MRGIQSLDLAELVEYAANIAQVDQFVEGRKVILSGWEQGGRLGRGWRRQRLWRFGADPFERELSADPVEQVIDP